MKKILGEAKTLRQLLGGTRYSIDYYQREYKWGRKHVRELLEDLTGKFLEFYSEGDERFDVEGYGHYFLGSIIISHKNNRSFIIDGQQRLTTLTLLFIYLHNNVLNLHFSILLCWRLLYLMMTSKLFCANCVLSPRMWIFLLPGGYGIFAS